MPPEGSLTQKEEPVGPEWYKVKRLDLPSLPLKVRKGAINHKALGGGGHWKLKSKGPISHREPTEGSTA